MMFVATIFVEPVFAVVVSNAPKISDQTLVIFLVANPEFAISVRHFFNLKN